MSDQNEEKTPLRKVIERRGYSIRAVAEASGVAETSLQGFWHGRRWPQWSTLRKIAVVLDVDPIELHPNRDYLRDGVSLKEVLEERGMSLRQLAEQTGLEYRLVLDLSTGRRAPHRETLEKIGAVLDLDWRRILPIESEVVEVPNALQKLLERRNITPPHLALLTGLNYPTVLDALHGRRNTLPETWQRIADALEVSVEELKPIDNATEDEQPSTPLARIATEAGFSIRRLAKESGLTYSTVFQIWHGRAKPRRTTLEKLAAVLNVEVADITESKTSDED